MFTEVSQYTYNLSSQQNARLRSIFHPDWDLANVDIHIVLLNMHTVHTALPLGTFTSSKKGGSCVYPQCSVDLYH